MSTTTSTALPTGLTTGTWAIDASHTEAGFTVRHAGISKVRGSVAVTEGTIIVGDDLETTSVTVTLDPSTVATGDANRDGHLKSGDFFDVEKFGQWTFVSTSVREDGSDYVIVGDLTIHGVTQSVELDTEFNGTAVDPFGNARAGFEATVDDLAQGLRPDLERGPRGRRRPGRRQGHHLARRLGHQGLTSSPRHDDEPAVPFGGAGSSSCRGARARPGAGRGTRGSAARTRRPRPAGPRASGTRSARGAKVRMPDDARRRRGASHTSCAPAAGVAMTPMVAPRSRTTSASSLGGCTTSPPTVVPTTPRVGVDQPDDREAPLGEHRSSSPARGRGCRCRR